MNKKRSIYKALYKSLSFFLLFSLFPSMALAALPASTNYKIQEYSFGSGGTKNSQSTNFNLNALLGEVESGQLSSTNFKAQTGLTFMQTSSLPPSPTFTNPNNYYNKLTIQINTGNNPSDAQFAIAIQNSSDGYTTTTYVQADHTLNTSPVWQTNNAWGASGFDIIGLTPGLTYRASVAAKQGNFTQTAYGPTAQVATNNPSFGFSLDTNTISMQLNPGSVTTSAIITMAISTNGTGGGVAYIHDANAGLLSSSTGYTISAVSNDLSSLTEGYGVHGTNASENFGGPMEILPPYNTTGTDPVGLIDNSKRQIADSSSQPVTNGQITFVIKAKASNTTKAALDYGDIITVIGSATF